MSSVGKDSSDDLGGGFLEQAKIQLFSLGKEKNETTFRVASKVWGFHGE
jgi:hypothetical protein